MQLSGDPIIAVNKFPCLGIAQFGIPDDPTTYEEKAPSNQLSLFEIDGEAEESEQENEDLEDELLEY